MNNMKKFYFVIIALLLLFLVVSPRNTYAEEILEENTLVELDSVNNIENINEEEISEENDEEIDELLAEPIDLDIEEINAFDYEITDEGSLNTVVEDKTKEVIENRIENSNLKDENVSIYVNYRGYDKTIYDADVSVYKDDVLVEQKEVQLTYTNTNNHTEEEQEYVDNFVENNSFDYEVIIEDDENVNLDDLVSETATNNNLKSIVQLPPFVGNEEDVPYAIFMNNKYYRTINANIKRILKVKVPCNETNIDEHILNRVKTYYGVEDNLRIVDNKVVSDNFETEFIIEREEPVEYKNENSNLTYEKETNDNININLNRTGNIKNVYLNNSLLSNNDYSINSNVLTIKNSILRNLSKGTYNINAIFLDGNFNTNIYVLDKSNNSGSTSGIIITPSRRYYRPRIIIHNEESNTEEIKEEVKEEDKTLESSDDILDAIKDQLEDSTKNIGKIKNIPTTKPSKPTTTKKTKKSNIPETVLFIVLLCIFASGVLFSIYKKENE